MGETETIKSSHLCGCVVHVVVVSLCLVIQIQGTMLIEAENKGEFIKKKKANKLKKRYKSWKFDNTHGS